MALIPLINGIQYGSPNIQVILPVLGLVVGISSINYSKEQTIEDNYGLGSDPVSRGFGQNKYSGDITIFKETWNKIIDISPLRDPSKLPLFDIAVVYTGAAGVRKEVLRAVSFKTNPVGVNAGDTKIMCKIDLAIGSIDF